MPPKRPPPLPKSLFTSGPLSPANLPHPPSPSTIHPAYITDAHHFGSPLALKAGDVPVVPVVQGAVGVDVDQRPKPAKSHTVKATSVSFDDGTHAQAFEPDTELVLPNTVPLTDAQWDHLDEAVNAADGGFEKVEADVAETGGVRRRILLAGLLPPPLTKPSSPLLQAKEYNVHVGRLSQLSLHADVVLKALPPVVDTRVAGPDKWWEDAKEVERVVKMYIAPAIETFGTHRIVFGSQPALLPTDPAVIVPISGAEWYRVLRKCVSELGEDADALSGVFGSNAAEHYGLS
ncbi:hypothetical protein VHUM_00745 [Vanrija humicola]|uniref:Amidohydrolase-related domain-containing protein n=1 Tax=Vanrija humicola TaxID=5417 RepID=A0A7D8V4C7_VANHU|nr:hypothetical protein VHUM_00745 [Vanrija humicola]